MTPSTVTTRLSATCKVLSVFLSLLGFFCLSSASAESNPAKGVSSNDSSPSSWTVDSRVDLLSSYIFRGKPLSSGFSVQPSVQPRYVISGTRSIDLLMWSHLPTSPDSFSEFDGSFAFSQKYSRATFSVGHRSYVVTAADSPLRSRSELWGSMALDTMLNPVFTVFEDYSRYNQQYYDITLSHTFEKSGDDAFNFGLFSSFGYVTNGREQYRANGLVQITSGVTTEWAVSFLKLKPTLAYTSAADSASRNSLWGGISLQGCW